MSDNPPNQLLAALDEAKVSRFHLLSSAYRDGG
jgi:hypothetical protein